MKGRRLTLAKRWLFNKEKAYWETIYIYWKKVQERVNELGMEIGHAFPHSSCINPARMHGVESNIAFMCWCPILCQCCLRKWKKTAINYKTIYENGHYIVPCDENSDYLAEAKAIQRNRQQLKVDV
jgi:hypothetical protein